MLQLLYVSLFSQKYTLTTVSLLFYRSPKHSNYWISKEPKCFYQFQGIFNCTATGYPRPTISWVKNDDPQALQTNPRVEEKVILLDNKTVRSQLLLTGTKMEDSGKYHCVANNSAGERVSRVSSLFTEDLGKRHSFFAPENDNLFLKLCRWFIRKAL